VHPRRPATRPRLSGASLRMLRSRCGGSGAEGATVTSGRLHTLCCGIDHSPHTSPRTDALPGLTRGTGTQPKDHTSARASARRQRGSTDAAPRWPCLWGHEEGDTASSTSPCDLMASRSAPSSRASAALASTAQSSGSCGALSGALSRSNEASSSGACHPTLPGAAADAFVESPMPACGGEPHRPLAAWGLAAEGP